MPGSVFDLGGPAFLAVYVAIGACVLVVARLRMYAGELTDVKTRIDLKEPLTIAYLRGGVTEVLRVAAFSLVDRNLLLFDGRTLCCAKSKIAGSFVSRPLEKALLQRLAVPSPTRILLADAALRSACQGYAESLRESGLVASAETYAARRPIFLLGAAILAGLAGFKIIVALGRGHTNIGFLCVFALAGLAILFRMYRRERTARGDRALANLKVLLAGRKRQSHRIQPGGASDDALLLAAVYGFAALPSGSFPYLGKLFPKGSGSSSSCGSSCGSGCGGGGCGGGCGGCGS
jgi:uncharacterized protein (TIGR04222 family)